MKNAPEPYEYFISKHERSDIYKFCKGLAEYLKTNNIPNVLFVDRSARPACTGVDEYWNQNFSGVPKPKFYFTNPDGFNTTLVRAPSIKEDEMLRLLVKKKEIVMVESGSATDNATMLDIADRFEEVYTQLAKEKDKPLVIFDTCSHTGGTINDIVEVLDLAGFTDIRIITANSPDPTSGITPATRIDKYTRLTSCYPFGQDDLIEKGTDVVSKRLKFLLRNSMVPSFEKRCAAS